MQLLLKDTGILLLGRHDDLYLIHKYWDDLWSENANQFLRYSLRQMRNNIYFHQDNMEEDIYEESLLSTIHGLSTMRKEDQDRILFQFLELDSIEVLAETNPELLSRVVLALLSNDEFHLKEIMGTVDIFLKSCLMQLENIEICFWRLGTIINAITIARIIQASWFLSEIGRLLRYQLFGSHPRLFWNFVYLYPKYVADLIDIMPELFSNAHLDIFDSPFIEKEFLNERHGKVIDYIRVFRCFYQLFDEKHNSKEIMSREMHMLDRVISEFIGLEKIEFSQLTIEQIGDLLWYINFVGDKRILDGMKKSLHKSLKYRRYRDITLFEKVFDTLLK